MFFSPRVIPIRGLPFGARGGANAATDLFANAMFFILTLNCHTDKQTYKNGRPIFDQESQSIRARDG